MAALRLSPVCLALVRGEPAKSLMKSGAVFRLRILLMASWSPAILGMRNSL